MYTIQTGKFEKGTKEQQSAFINLFGCENIQYKFDFYFHWYNIVHEYGHCLCSHSNSDIIGLKQEFLVNDFAVNLWAYAGYEKELKALYKMLNEILERIKNPVPETLSFIDYYGQIWESDKIMEVPIYGYFQFKSVQMALEDRRNLKDIFREMGIKREIKECIFSYKEYVVSSEMATEVLCDIRMMLKKMNIEQPAVNIELVDDPSVHCVRYDVD